MLHLHNGLNHHMYRIGRRTNPLCSRCGEGREIPLQVFEDYVTLLTTKYSIFGLTAITLEEIVHKRRLDELLMFVS